MASSSAGISEKSTFRYSTPGTSGISGKNMKMMVASAAMMAVAVTDAVFCSERLGMILLFSERLPAFSRKKSPAENFCGAQ